jgi:hypothetical protein
MFCVMYAEHTGILYKSRSNYIATDGQSAVHLGVELHLEQMNRFDIYLSGNYFHSSCGAPALTRGRVYNLECNYASSSYIAIDGQSASS